MTEDQIIMAKSHSNNYHRIFIRPRKAFSIESAFLLLNDRYNPVELLGCGGTAILFSYMLQHFIFSPTVNKHSSFSTSLPTF